MHFCRCNFRRHNLWEKAKSKRKQNSKKRTIKCILAMEVSGGDGKWWTMSCLEALFCLEAEEEEEKWFLVVNKYSGIKTFCYHYWPP